MPKCQFTSQYHDHKISDWVIFKCQEDPLASGRCIFHDNNYCLRNKTNHEKHQRKVLDRLKHKVNHAISNNEPLFCIGFQLPEFSLSDLGIISKEFTIPVYFSQANFQQEADFSGAKFQAKANFTEVTFQREAFFQEAKFQELASFYSVTFQREAFFQEANFEGKAYFNKAKFQREANFYKASFKKGRADL